MSENLENITIQISENDDHEQQENEAQAQFEREIEQQRQREREAQEQREREQREREAHEQREREVQEQREREQREREAQEQREREAQEQREREQREREAHEQREREAQEQREREQREREQREREAHEQREREVQEQREREAQEQREREQREREAQAHLERGLEAKTNIPTLIFIVPYRDREQQKAFFESHMKLILSDYDPSTYEIHYIHQSDKRDFNRGAIKNIGFLFIKNKYPNDYQKITLVFNDIDTMPYTKNFLDYPTTPGIVKHFYGYRYALGGIVSITAGDFEKINGFPNFWSWGYEDNELNKRCLSTKLTIDRSQFYPIMDKNIYQMKDGLFKTVNRNEFQRYMSNSNEGISSIKKLEYEEEESTGMVHVTGFSTGIEPTPIANKEHDIRKGSRPFGNPPSQGRGGSMKMFF